VDAIWAILGIASFVGAVGFAVGSLIGRAVVRWCSGAARVGRAISFLVGAVLLVIGIQQASAVRTVPKSNADARAHDYSLARLDQALIVWVCGANAVGAAIGIRRRTGRVSVRPERGSAETQNPGV
jgi:hypothetical protein